MGERGQEYGYFETFLRQLVPPNGFTARWGNGARGINTGWLGQVGSAQAAALQGTLQVKVLFRIFCLRILILLNTFFCVFLGTFSSGGVPPDTFFIDCQVIFGDVFASGDPVCFFIDF